MRAVITVVGKDQVGILANVSAECAKYNVNIVEVTQSILQEMFTMIMIVEMNHSNIPMTEFSEKLSQSGQEMNLDIRVMHEDIFNAMHRI